MSSKQVATQGQDVTPMHKNLAALEALAAEAGATEVESNRPKVKIDELGDILIGKLVEVRTFDNDKGGKPLTVAYFDLHDGSPVRLNLSTDAARKVTGEKIGHWLSVANAGVMDTGHPSGTPMTVYQVYDFGTRLPERAAKLAASLDLPF